MKFQFNGPNCLKLVQELNLSQVKVPYLDVEYCALDNQSENNQKLQFPRLIFNDLCHISLDRYQINSAASYYAKYRTEEIFLIQKFAPQSKHRIASLDYAQYRIAIEKPLRIVYNGDSKTLE